MNRQSVQELFSLIASSMPDQTAIESPGRRVSYRELEENSNSLANFLIARETPKGSIVGILAEDTVDVVTAIIGILKAGCVFVPLDPLRIPEQRLRAMIAEVSPVWFVTTSKYLGKLSSITANPAARVVCLDQPGTIADLGDSALLVEYCAAYPSTEQPNRRSGPDDMCYVYFTSGSTGRPKGIAGRLKGIDHFINWEIKTLNLKEGTRVSQFTTPSFDAYLRDIFVPLCCGGTICATNEAEMLLDGNRLIQEIDAQQLNVMHCVPSLFRLITNQDLNRENFPSLKFILLAGEPLLVSDVKKWMDVFGDRIQLINLYGPTETTMTKFFYLVSVADKDRRSISIGKPMEGARALVLDNKGQVCPPGTVGEIYIRTPYRTLGYYNQPELTSEVFVQNPFSNDPEDIVYKTGDLGRTLEDGNFEFLGRKDQQVKIRGVRIELQEIEDLLRAHPAVKDVVVIDLSDASENKYLSAYVVLSKKTEAAELKEFLLGALPEYMVPSAFVTLDELPRTISGKVDRKSLPSPAQARSEHKDFAEPRTPLEQQIAETWAQVLGVERISIHDNFFELGGHSLLATQLLSRVRAVLQVEVPLRALFRAPTVAGMALTITQIQVEQEDDEEMARMIEEIKQMTDQALDLALNDEPIELTATGPFSESKGA
jgi:amino acid adenylation domain-containing protein